MADRLDQREELNGEAMRLDDLPRRSWIQAHEKFESSGRGSEGRASVGELNAPEQGRRYHTKSFYRDKSWDAIINHPEFTLGGREIEALVRFLSTVAGHFPAGANILHLGIGNGREVPWFVETLKPTGLYVINDICEPVLKQVVQGVKQEYPTCNFVEALGDIESTGVISSLRNELSGPVLIVMTANSVIFSNRNLDGELRNAMRPGDLFLVTVENPHEGMYQSYVIEPVYRLLAGSGLDIKSTNTRAWYDTEEQCLKLACGGHTLLSAYKPRPDQLLSRMESAGMVSVELVYYDDLQMIAGLFQVAGDESDR